MPVSQNIWNVEWLNANSQRKYPLRDDATLADTSSTITIPNSLITDFRWPIVANDAIDPTGFYVYSISIFGTGVTIEIGYSGEVVGSVVIDNETFTDNKSFRISGLGDFADTVGTIIIGKLEEVLTLAGTFNFSGPAASGFLPTTVLMVPKGVSAIYLKNGSDLSDALQNDITIEAGRNFAVSFQERDGTPTDPHVVSLSAIDGAGLNSDCDCSESADRPCIKTIDGVGPDPDTEDFLLEDSDCLKLEGIANGLKIKNECATPCCGCEELEIVNSTLERVVGQVNALASLASAIQAQVANLETNILVSK